MDDVTPADIAAAEAAWNAEADEFNQWGNISVGEQEALVLEAVETRQSRAASL